VDDLGAGLGSYVLVTTDGDLARQKLADNTTPSRMIVVGIIDHASGASAREGGRADQSEGLSRV
jgi:microcompartment protein CcmK/EutM